MSTSRYASLAITCLLALSAGAQFMSLSAPGNVPVPGSPFVVHRGAYVAIPPTPGTDEQLFNFAAVTGTSTLTCQWHDPSSLPNGATFPGAQVALTDGGPDTVFYAATANGLERLGDTQTISALGTDYHFTTSYSDPIVDLALPLANGDTWSDLFQGAFTVDGTSATRTGGINGAGSGWGLLVMPGGNDTTAVLRVTSVLTESIPMTVSGFSITVTHKRHVDAFYPLWGKYPVYRTVSDSLTSQFLNQDYSFSEWLDASAVGVDEHLASADQVACFPNPASSRVEVVLPQGLQGVVQVEAVDQRGAVVFAETLRSGRVAAKHGIDVSAWKAGLYHVVLTDEAGTRVTGRFLVAH
jgi:hypothetical protein